MAVISDDHPSELFCLLCQKQIPSIRHCENGIQHLVRVPCQYHKIPSTGAVIPTPIRQRSESLQPNRQ
jgi:predicted amidophosphoribosyltransferase